MSEDFSDWSTARLASQLEHLDRLLQASAADPTDPLRAQLRAERKAVLEALGEQQQARRS